MVMISPNKAVMTLVNVFSVDPSQQQQLVDLLITATDTVMRQLPGYISANIHTSLDGTHVVNYAQWHSREAFEAMLRNPDAQIHMQQAAAIARAEPQLYTVVYSDEGGGAH